jgi:hypothetical protein
VDFLVLVIFAAVSLPAFFIGHHMRTRTTTTGIGGRMVAGAIDPELSAFIGKTMQVIGALIVTTGIALSSVPQTYQMPIGIAFVVVCNLLVATIVFRAWRSQRQRRER